MVMYDTEHKKENENWSHKMRTFYMTEEVVTLILSGIKRATLLIFITTGIPPPNRLSHLIEGVLILEGNSFKFVSWIIAVFLQFL